MVSRYLYLWFTIKSLVMYALLCLDLAFLCTAEWENLGFLKQMLKKDKIVVLVTFIMQLLIQILITLTVFVFLGGTYLLKVGMIGVLFKQFKRILQIHLLYFCISAVIGYMRLQALAFPGDYDFASLWTCNSFFFPLSVVQKFAAAIYYLGNLQLLRELATPRWYRKEDWVAMYKQQAFASEFVKFR